MKSRHLLIIHKFCSDHNAGDQKAVNVERSKTNPSALKEPFDVYVCNNKARRAAACVLENALDIPSDAQGGNF